MKRRRIELGLLFSRSGSYTLIAEACRKGALGAVSWVNANPAFDLTFAPLERDPGGDIDLYAPLCEEILHESTARHIVGCVTSWSRKEVIPVLEKQNATLWYAVPYEGFEASDHVVYTHACPNQHLLPLLDWAFPRYGRRTYLTGSNYIWGWEMNRLAREVIVGGGGAVLGERYLPLGSLDVKRIVDEVLATDPDFILNTLIGPSQYSFVSALRRAGAVTPVLSCNLTECELPAMGAEAEGLIAVGPYFCGTHGEPQEGVFGSSHEAAAFAAVHELARLLNRRPGAESLSLPELLSGAMDSMVHPETHHTKLPVLIAEARHGRFEIIEARALVAGDPFLARPPARQTWLRVVK